MPYDRLIRVPKGLIHIYNNKHILQMCGYKFVEVKTTRHIPNILNGYITSKIDRCLKDCL